jgi:RNA polymerase sigma-70 factor (ECF subfamily)
MRQGSGQRVNLTVLPGGPLVEQDDAALALALIAEDPSAPRVAWHRFAAMVHRILKRTLGPGADVEDLVQEVFLCLFDRVKTLREPKALKAFVIAIAAMTVRAELRRRRTRRMFWLEIATPPPPVYPDPEARQALVHFYKILDRLGDQDRTAFVLRFMEEMELTDVASALQTSLSTTKRRLSRVWQRVTLLVERDPALAHYLTSLKRGEALQ